MPCEDCAALARVMEERDRRYALHFDMHQRAQVLSADTNVRWQANANEWRQAMTDREAQFLSRGMGLVIGALSVIATLVSVFLHK